MYRVLYSSLYIFGSRHQRLAIRNFFKLLNISLECPHLLLVFLEIQVAVLCTSIMTMPDWGMLKIAFPKFLLLFLLFSYVIKSWLSIKKLFKNGMLIIFSYVSEITGFSIWGLLNPTSPDMWLKFHLTSYGLNPYRPIWHSVNMWLVFRSRICLVFSKTCSCSQFF